MNITNYFLQYCTWKILSIQTDFLLQKSAIQEVIINTRNAFTRYKILFYSKFHFELNYIKYFWYNANSWIRRNYKYSINELRKNVSKSLNQIKSSTILRKYKSCYTKMDLY